MLIESKCSDPNCKFALIDQKNLYLTSSVIQRTDALLQDGVEPFLLLN
jgi:hypothetical protein